MTKQKTLQARLAQTLDKRNKKQKKEEPRSGIPAAGKRCKKLSVSLFETDLNQISLIRSYLAQHGEMISTSQAVKLALRTAQLTDELQTALDQVRKEDGRKW